LRGPLEGERPLDEGRVRVGADDGRVDAPADEHDHCVEDDGFACTCFTREDDETGIKAQVELIYNCEVLDVKFGKHGYLNS